MCAHRNILLHSNVNWKGDNSPSPFQGKKKTCSSSAPSLSLLLKKTIILQSFHAFIDKALQHIDSEYLVHNMTIERNLPAKVSLSSTIITPL